MSRLELEKQLLIRFEDATLGYPGKILFQDFSWEIYRGDKILITGPNGCGKTTLIRTILGLIPPLKGSLEYYSTQGTSCQTINRGYLPQVNTINKHFPITLGEVIAQGLSRTSLSTKEKKQRTHELLEQVGLSELQHECIDHLSGGQLQRLLLARAIAPKPELLVLDEPNTYLDKAHRKLLCQMLEELSLSEKTTLLMVTHDRLEDYHSWEELALPLL